MPEIQTKHFNRVQYREEDLFQFPNGLPGFEKERAFVPLELAAAKPLLLLQSIQTPDLCFLTMPVRVADQAYRLEITREDLKAIGLPEDRQPEIGKDVLCVGIIAIDKDRAPTVNLLAPLVVNLKNLVGVQAIMAESGYSHQHELPVPEPETEAAC